VGGRASLRRPAYAGALALLAIIGAAAAVAAPAAGHPARPVRAATTGNNSERISRLPITRSQGAVRRVAMSLGPGKLGRLRRGDKLKLSGEVEVTTTCVTPGSRCIGKHYSFSPTIDAQLVIAHRKRAATGRAVQPLSRHRSIACHQPRPNRNHHCVLVFDDVTKRLAHPKRLPCRLRKCRINLVLDAHDPAADGREKVIVGADRPGGGIQQDMGRLNAIVIPRGAKPHVRTRTTRHIVTHGIPEGSPGSGGWQVIYSVKLKHLRRGEVIAATARELTGIGQLPYSAFISSELLIAPNPHATHPFGHAISLGGLLTEANGFNCTQGPSAYETPCLTRKAGVARVRHKPRGHKGHTRPVYLNVISRSFPKLAHAGAGDAARVLGGALTVHRYRKRAPPRRSRRPGHHEKVMFPSHCTNEAFKPKSLGVDCQNGVVYTTGMKWQRWTTKVAVGSGVAHVNSCDPDCGTGNVTTVPAGVRLFAPTRCGKVQQFTRLFIRFEDPVPGPQTETYLFDCH
jgi:hypothetical protein